MQSEIKLREKCSLYKSFSESSNCIPAITYHSQNPLTVFHPIETKKIKYEITSDMRIFFLSAIFVPQNVMETPNYIRKFVSIWQKKFPAPKEISKIP